MKLQDVTDKIWHDEYMLKDWFDRLSTRHLEIQHYIHGSYMEAVELSFWLSLDLEFGPKNISVVKNITIILQLIMNIFWIWYNMITPRINMAAEYDHIILYCTISTLGSSHVTHGLKN
jgi:hypothetical protein